MERFYRIFKNILLSKSFDKLLAFILSFCLWLFVVSGKSVTEKINLLLVYKIDKELSFIKHPPRKIKVRYQGARAYWNRIPEGQEVEIDLTKYRKKKNRIQKYELSKKDLPFIPGLNLVDYDLDQLEFSLGSKVTKSVPVLIKKMGELPKGLKIETIKINPKEVMISGARKIVGKVKNISTEWIELSSLTVGTYQKKLKLNIQNNLKSSEKIVQVSIDVRKKNAKKLTKSIPIDFLSRGQKFQTKSSLVEVIYHGDQSSLVDQSVNISAIVKIPKKFSGQKIWAPVEINAPDGINIIEFTPRRVEIFK